MAATILVVDDERESSFLLSQRLRKRDYEAQFCFGTKEALEILSRQPFDVVILSLSRANVRGMAALKQIKRRQPLTEVIFMSADTAGEKAVWAMQMGAFDYLEKPCRIERITAKVNTAYLQKFAQEERIRRAIHENEMHFRQGKSTGALSEAEAP